MCAHYLHDLSCFSVPCCALFGSLFIDTVEKKKYKIDPWKLGHHNSSVEYKKEFERWDRSNRMSLVIIKYGILETFRGTVSGEVNNAK